MDLKPDVLAKFIGFLIVVLAVASCTTTPEAPEQLPDWIGQPAKVEGKSVEIVAFGRDMEARAADESATEDAVSQLLKYAERFAPESLRILEKRRLSTQWRRTIIAQLGHSRNLTAEDDPGRVSVFVIDVFRKRSAVTAETYLHITADFKSFAEERERLQSGATSPERVDSEPERGELGETEAEPQREPQQEPEKQPDRQPENLTDQEYPAEAEQPPETGSETTASDHSGSNVERTSEAQPELEPETEPEVVPPPIPHMQRFRRSISTAADAEISREERLAAWEAAIGLSAQAILTARTENIGLLNRRIADQQIEIVVPNGLGPVTFAYPGKMMDRNRPLIREVQVPAARVEDDIPTTVVRDLPPEPGLVGAYQVTVRPSWWPAVFRQLRQMDDIDTGSALATMDENLTAIVTIRVQSLADRIPTAVALLETDIAGNPMDGDQATVGLVSGLEDAGFRVSVAGLPAGAVQEIRRPELLEPERLYDLLPFEALTSNERAIVGVAGISDFHEDERYQVHVSVRIAVFDLRRDTLLVTATITANSQGNSSQAAIKAAMRHAGIQTARYVVPRLP